MYNTAIPYVLRHVSQLDKPSKRYRNVHADVFVIADEDEETGKKWERKSGGGGGGGRDIDMALCCYRESRCV